MVTSAGARARAAPVVDAAGNGHGNGNGTTETRWGSSTNAEAEANATETTALLDGAPGSGLRDDVSAPRKDSWAGSEDFEGLPWWRRPSVWWLMAPYALFTLAFGGSMVPRLNLIVDLVCKRYFADKSAADPVYVLDPIVPGADNPQCRADPDVQANVATFTLIISVMTGTLSALTAPKLGSLSDRYGRKRLIVISSFGAIVGEVITILAAKYPDLIHYRWLLVGAFFDGLTGSFTAGSVMSHAYTSDCTPPSKRSVAIGYLHACLFTGLAFGPLIAGYLVEWTGSLLSIFYITLGCHVFFILFLTFAVPESLSIKRQLIARERHAAKIADLAPPPRWVLSIAAHVPLGDHMSDTIRSAKAANPLSPLSILFPKGSRNARLRRNFLILAFIDMGLLGAVMGAGTVTILYTGYMFGWGTLESSRYVSMVSMVRVVVLMCIFPVVNYIFRTRPHARRRREEGGPPIVEKNAGSDTLDLWVLRSALLSDVIGSVGYIFVRTEPLFILCAIITGLGGMGSATIQASLTKHVPPERVGGLLGAIGLLHSLARVFSPIAFNGLYAATVKFFPQAFFVLLAGLFTASLVVSMMLKPHVYLEEDDAEPEPTSPNVSAEILRDTLEDDELIPTPTA